MNLTNIYNKYINICFNNKHILSILLMQINFLVILSQATFYPRENLNQNLFLVNSQINNLDAAQGSSYNYYFPCLSFPPYVFQSGLICNSEEKSTEDTYSFEKLKILGIASGLKRLVSAIHTDNKTVNGITNHYANFYVNNKHSFNVFDDSNFYIKSGSPRYEVNISYDVPTQNRPFKANASYYSLLPGELTIGISKYHDPDNNPDLPSFQTTRKLKIPISSVLLKNHIDNFISINTLTQVDLSSCSINSFFRCERRTPETFTKFTIVGYRDLFDNKFPTNLFYDTHDIRLEGWVYLINDRSLQIVNTYLSWSAEENRLWDGGRELLEGKFVINTEIVSGQEHSHEENSHLFSFNEDNTLENYAVMDYFDTKLNLYNSNNELVNSIDFDVKNPESLHSFRLDGRRLQFISKADNNEVVDLFAEECLTIFPKNEHRLLVGDDKFMVIANSEIVWTKNHNEKHVCSFPKSGQSSLGNNQKLIPFDSENPTENNLTYLLSEDKTKITIKDGEELKVIDKDEYIRVKGHIKDAIPIQKLKL